MQELIEELAAALAGAKRVVVLTGAGTSAESGVPTFRGGGPDALWKGFDPMKLATPGAFVADPDQVWEWYEWRRAKIAACEPNPGHHALAELEGLIDDFLLVTQNVDRLHQAAGSRALIELHGDLWTLRCFHECGFSEERRSPPAYPPLPRCGCGALLRPGVVWFGEGLPPGAMERAFARSTRAEVFLVVGTSCVVYPAASLAEVAGGAGARVFEVNPVPASRAPGVRVLAGPSGEVLPRVVSSLRRRLEA